MGLPSISPNTRLWGQTALTALSGRVGLEAKESGYPALCGNIQADRREELQRPLLLTDTSSKGRRRIVISAGPNPIGMSLVFVFSLGELSRDDDGFLIKEDEKQRRKVIQTRI